jgi:hypothetical protein
MGIGIIPDSDVGKVIDIIDGFSFNAVMLAPTEGTKRYVRYYSDDKDDTKRRGTCHGLKCWRLVLHWRLQY